MLKDNFNSPEKTERDFIEDLQKVSYEDKGDNHVLFKDGEVDDNQKVFIDAKS